MSGDRMKKKGFHKRERKGRGDDRNKQMGWEKEMIRKKKRQRIQKRKVDIAFDKRRDCNK